MNKFQTPKLAAPGAGLPFIESIVLRYLYFPSRLRRSTWGENLDRLQYETKKIVDICDGLTETEFQTRMLIKRLRGMEDSSRFWSVALTIDHLLITMKGMAHVAFELAQGHELSIHMGTADVKPKQEDVTNKGEMINNLQKATDETVSKLKAFENNHSNQYQVHHPWFGMINCEAWVWTLGQHQALHRNQIQLIIGQL